MRAADCEPKQSPGTLQGLVVSRVDKFESYCRPLVKYPPVDVFRAERGGVSTFLPPGPI
jgi:hypothetical protein